MKNRKQLPCSKCLFFYDGKIIGPCKDCIKVGDSVNWTSKDPDLILEWY